MTDQKKNEIIDSLQVIRTIAFLAIFLFHDADIFPGEGAFFSFLKKTPGRWGVSVFFVLSGFVMTYSYWNRPPKTRLKDALAFSFKKIKKLYPLHLLMLLIGAVYLFLHHDPLTLILAQLSVTVPLIQTWLPIFYQSVNSVSWYLSVCIFLYFCFPCLLVQIKKERSRILSLLMITAIILAQLAIGFFVFHFTDIDIKWITYCHPLFRLGDFTVGSILASIYLKRTPKEGSAQIPRQLYSAMEIAVLIINISVCVTHWTLSQDAKWFSYTSLFLPSTALLIYVFSLNKGILSQLLANRFVLWLAKISPYTYLIHKLLMYYFRDFCTYVLHDEEVSHILAIMVPFGLTILATYAYLALERNHCG